MPNNSEFCSSAWRPLRYLLAIIEEITDRLPGRTDIKVAKRLDCGQLAAALECARPSPKPRRPFNSLARGEKPLKRLAES